MGVAMEATIKITVTTIIISRSEIPSRSSPVRPLWRCTNPGSAESLVLGLRGFSLNHVRARILTRMGLFDAKSHRLATPASQRCPLSMTSRPRRRLVHAEIAELAVCASPRAVGVQKSVHLEGSGLVD